MDELIEVPLRLADPAPTAPEVSLTIRLDEVDSTGAIISRAIQHQLIPLRTGDRDGADALRSISQASDNYTLRFEMGGKTDPDHQRYFRLDRADGSPQESEEHRIHVTDGHVHEGQDSYLIENAVLRAWYHKAGGALASILDREGNDWISYRPVPGPCGDARGIPNLRYPEGYFHPGSELVTSRLKDLGSVSATLISESSDGGWLCIWDVLPNRVRLTVERAEQPFWFLYEGTPAGRFDVIGTTCAISDGRSAPLSSVWETQVSGNKWAMFSSDSASDVLYIIYHSKRDAVFSYAPMGNCMTVFGIGRSMSWIPDSGPVPGALPHLLRVTPARFEVGITRKENAANVLNALTNPSTVSVTAIDQ